MSSVIIKANHAIVKDVINCIHIYISMTLPGTGACSAQSSVLMRVKGVDPFIFVTRRLPSVSRVRMFRSPLCVFLSGVSTDM